MALEGMMQALALPHPVRKAAYIFKTIFLLRGTCVVWPACGGPMK